MQRISCLLILAAFIYFPVEANSVSVDLSKIGYLKSKGRVQDQNHPVVKTLIKAGPSAIPFLVSKIEDQTLIQTQLMDYWPLMQVGDVALIILTDFFTTSDWTHTSIPGFSWDEILERKNKSTAAAWDLLHNFIAKHGRSGLRRRVEELLKPYHGDFYWDHKERCFMPAGQGKQ
jgi:hypothetical protein